MTPSEHTLAVMLPHLLRLIQVDRDYAVTAIRRYFELCPWAEPLIGGQLRSAWKSPSEPSPS
jgi:hypothetical protein